MKSGIDNTAKKTTKLISRVIYVSSGTSETQDLPGFRLAGEKAEKIERKKKEKKEKKSETPTDQEL